LPYKQLNMRWLHTNAVRSESQRVMKPSNNGTVNVRGNGTPAVKDRTHSEVGANDLRQSDFAGR